MQYRSSLRIPLRPPGRPDIRVSCILLLLILVTFPAPVTAEESRGVIALQQGATFVDPGEIFELEITIPAAADSFNAYDCTNPE